MKTRFLVSALLGTALLLGTGAAAQAEEDYRNPAGHRPPGLERQDKAPPDRPKRTTDIRGKNAAITMTVAIAMTMTAAMTKIKNTATTAMTATAATMMTEVACA